MKNIKEFAAKHKIITLIIMSFILAFFTILAASSTASFLYKETWTSAYVNDPNMFYYMGLMFAKGKTPYLEIFDHKGLYMFYYTGLGALLGGRIGMFIVQVLFMSVTYYFLILTMKELKLHKFIIFTSSLLFLVIYVTFMQSPGDAEPQLPFVALMLYFYAKAITNKKDKDFIIANLLAGICAGIAINIRASDAILPLALTISYFVYSIIHKNYKPLILSAVFAILGLLFTSFIPFIHSYIGGFSKEMYQSIIFDNLKYTSTSEKGGMLITPILARIMIILIYGIFALLLIIQRKKLDKDEIVFLSISGIITMLFELLIAHYLHYLIILFPYLIVTYSRLISLFFIEEKKYHLSFKLSSLVLAIASVVTLPIYYYSYQYSIEKEIVTAIRQEIPSEEYNGHVLALSYNPSIYLNVGITVGYGDFNTQLNHIRISSIYTEEVLFDYLKGGDCHYVITYNFKEDTKDIILAWFNKSEGNEYYQKTYSDPNLFIFKYVK